MPQIQGRPFRTENQDPLAAEEQAFERQRAKLLRRYNGNSTAPGRPISAFAARESLGPELRRRLLSSGPFTLPTLSSKDVIWQRCNAWPSSAKRSWWAATS